FQGTPIGTDNFTAGVILAVMIIPTISAVSREALLAVPGNQREAALSLGATRWETTRLAVLRYARAGIFGAIVLGLGRAVGETMAVTMMIGNKNSISVSLFDQGQTIASLIANSFAEAGPSSLQLAALIELGLVPLGSILLEAAVRGFQAIGPSFFLLDTAYGGIGNAIQGTLILVALASAISLPIGILTGIYLSEFGKNRFGQGIRFFVDVM